MSSQKSLTQSEVAYQGLKQDILECRLMPLARIKTSYVCETYEISLGAAREALSRLTADGIVVMEAQKGFSVAPVSWEECEQLTETRAEIEVSCLRKSILNGDLEWESRLAAALHRLTRLHNEGLSWGPSGPEAPWLEAHAEFHRALVAASPNRFLLELRETLYIRSERYRHWALRLSLARSHRDVRAEHMELAQLAQARDVDAACAAVYEHFMRTAQDLVAAARAAGDAIPDWRTPARKG